MSRKLISVGLSILGGTALAYASACSSDSSPTQSDAGDAASSSSSGSSSGGGSGSSSGSSSGGGSGGSSGGGSGSSSGAASDGGAVVLIDDMEPTNPPGAANGPIKLMPFPAGEYPGYWYDGMSNGDTRNTITPATTTYGYSMLPMSHMTMTGITSTRGAHVACTLWDTYGYCQEAFEFAQVNSGVDAGTVIPLLDAGLDGTLPDAGTLLDGSLLDAARDAASDATSSVSDAAAEAAAGDASAAITPRTTVPFDVSPYTGVTFWAMTGGDAGTTNVIVGFPNVDTDPRGGRCLEDGGGKCYDNFARTVMFTGTWTKVTVPFGVLAQAGWGHAAPTMMFDATKVYGITFQVSGPQVADAGAPVNADIWIDDIYFTK
ncbi:MAG: hypothetical protein M3O46_03500 [Myxococcota bacterium]|nr:hypothetical protein [Myxococcota bacterium]